MPHEVAAIRRSSISISRTPEEKYRNKHICATGKISDYKGVPEIVAYDPSRSTSADSGLRRNAHSRYGLHDGRFPIPGRN